MSRLSAIEQECDCYAAGASPESLPCGGCSYCVRAHNQWSRFTDEVDDVIPLVRKSIPFEEFLSENPSDAYNIFVASLQDDHYLSISWVEGYSAAVVGRMQREDVDISVVIKWVEKNVEPEKLQLHLQSPVTRALWLLRNILASKMMYCTMSG
jgi:hypothetical protein